MVCLLESSDLFSSSSEKVTLNLSYDCLTEGFLLVSTEAKLSKSYLIASLTRLSLNLSAKGFDVPFDSALKVATDV